MKEMVKFSFFNLVQKLWPLLRAYRLRLGGGVVLLACTTVMDVVNPYLVGKAVDLVTLGRPWEELRDLCVIFFGLVLVRTVLETFQAYLIQVTGVSITQTLRSAVFDRLIHMPVPYFDKNPSGRLLTRVINDVKSLSELFTASMSVVILDTMIILGTIGAMFFMHWQLAAVSLIAFPAITWVVFGFGNRLAQEYRVVRQKLAHINAFLGENTGAVATIQRLGAEPDREKRFAELIQSHQDSQSASIRVYSSIQPWTNVINGVSAMTLLGVGGYWISQGRMTLGVLVAFLGYLRNLFQPIRDLVEKYNVFLSAQVAGERLASVLSETPEDLDSPPFDVPEAPLTLTFDNVSFSYPGNQEVVLDQVSFSVSPGEQLAVVGTTGSGKSTLARLLLRFYEASSGEIRIGERPITQFNRRSVRTAIGYLPQEIYLFQGTLRENLLIGRAKTSDAILEANCRSVDLWSRVADRGGLDFPILEGATNLSMGERQLVSFARLLTLNPRVLILDEATASLDNRLEKTVMWGLDKLIEGRSVITIAHRISTLAKADRVIVLEKGKIVEEGRYEFLKSAGGAFQKYWNLFEQIEEKA